MWLGTYAESCEALSKMLMSMDFSVTIADPCQASCPLVAVSDGFEKLTGFKRQDILGLNCRFVLDGVPKDLIDSRVRADIRQYIEQCLPASKQKPPSACFSQINARPDGKLFRSDFLLHYTKVCGQPFIVGLQTDAADFPLPASSFSHLKLTLKNLKGFLHIQELPRGATVARSTAHRRAKSLGNRLPAVEEEALTPMKPKGNSPGSARPVPFLRAHSQPPSRRSEALATP
jgi:hypothetical protein